MWDCTCLAAPWAERPGRKPKLDSENPGSKIGVRTCRMACWSTRSITFGTVTGDCTSSQCVFRIRHHHASLSSVARANVSHPPRSPEGWRRVVGLEGDVGWDIRGAASMDRSWAAIRLADFGKKSASAGCPGLVDTRRISQLAFPWDSCGERAVNLLFSLARPRRSSSSVPGRSGHASMTRPFTRQPVWKPCPSHYAAWGCGPNFSPRPPPSSPT